MRTRSVLLPAQNNTTFTPVLFDAESPKVEKNVGRVAQESECLEGSGRGG